jgi:hypothetical protein
MMPEDMMPIESDQAQMWTLGEDRTTVRLALPPLPPDGMPEPVRVALEDAKVATIEVVWRRNLRSRWHARPLRPAPRGSGPQHQGL